MNRFVLTAFVLLSSFALFAEKIEVDGIYYNITSSSTVEVTFRGDDEDGWMYYQPIDLYVGGLDIPSSIEYNGVNYQVTAIGVDAFANSRLMFSLSLPSTIKSIGNGAFSLCNALEYIMVDEENQNFLSEGGILYSKNPMTIYYTPRAISGDIVLNDAITSIPSSAFQNCKYITSVTIPENVTSIMDGAFDGCSSITEVFFNDKLTTIGEYAFSKCSSLAIVSLPESLREIKHCAFVECTGLSYVLFHEGIETIGKMAFYQCENILGVQLPSTLKSIEEKAFYGCENLSQVMNKSSLNVEAGSTSHGYVAYYATEVISESTDVSLSPIVTPTYSYEKDGVVLRNCRGCLYYIYTLDGILLQSGVCEEDVKRVETPLRVVVRIDSSK